MGSIPAGPDLPTRLATWREESPVPHQSSPSRQLRGNRSLGKGPPFPLPISRPQFPLHLRRSQFPQSPPPSPSPQGSPITSRAPTPLPPAPSVPLRSLPFPAGLAQLRPSLFPISPPPFPIPTLSFLIPLFPLRPTHLAGGGAEGEGLAVVMTGPVQRVLQLGPGAALRLTDPLLALVVHDGGAGGRHRPRPPARP